MPRVSLVGNGHGGSEDYATLALWWAAESGTDYGSQIEAQCLGDVGSGATLSGSTPHGYSIYTLGVTYDGTNDSSLSTATQLTVDSVGTVQDLKVTSATSFRSLRNSVASTFNRLFVENTSTGTAIQDITNVAGANYNNCVVDGPIQTTFNDGAAFNNITQFGSGS